MDSPTNATESDHSIYPTDTLMGFLVARLKEFGATPVYELPVPQVDAANNPIAYPLVVIELDPGADLYTTPNRRVWTELSFSVRAVIKGTTSRSRLRPLAGRLHWALAFPCPIRAPDGGMIHTCRRTAPVDYPSRENDVDYRHLGGLYTAHVSPP